MIDVHSHILPEFDDGAQSMEMSLEMLRESKRQGVDVIVSTSHCYPRESNSIDDFINDRNEAVKELRRAIGETGEELPEIYAGCELNLCRDISDNPRLHELCIEGTDYLLLEMPYTPWQDWCIDAVYKISISGITPVMAHIDRFLDQKLLSSLFELDVLYQVNADAFLDKRMKRHLDGLFENGRIHFLGSDTHNMGNRKPNIGAAREKILKTYGESYWVYFEENNSRLIANEELNPFAHKKLEKKTLFTRLFGR